MASSFEPEFQNEFIQTIIVGAGPGDPDLLTVKAHRAILQADLVLYDSLIGDQILKIIPQNCEKIYVGKTYKDNQDQEQRQNRINDLMKKAYFEGKRIVRLKTGDPLIFGRGIEEVRFLRIEGIDYELVPGITAGLAAANHCQIPVTERSINRSLLFCTGTTIENNLTQFDAIASMINLGTPVVVYMGLNNIENIIQRLIENRVASSTSICAVSQVSYPTEKMVFGNLETFVRKLAANPLDMPTVIIIGKNISPMIENVEEHIGMTLCN